MGSLLMSCSYAMLLLSIWLHCCSGNSLSSSTYGFKLFKLKGGVSSKVKQADTAREFDNLIWGHQEDLVVVDFSASWCGPCKMMAPVFDQISMEKQHRNVMFIKVDVEKNRDIAARYGVTRMPTFLFLKNRKELDRFSGADIVRLKENIQRLS